MSLKYVDIFNSVSVPPAIIFLAVVAMWSGKMLKGYSDAMLKQVDMIHQAQLHQMERSDRMDQRLMNEMKELKIMQYDLSKDIQSVSGRVHAIEVYNEILGLPLYTDDKGRIYYQEDSFGKKKDGSGTKQ